MIVRTSHRPKWAVIPRPLLEDVRLSYEALGLICHLLGKPDDWTAHKDQLARVRNVSGYAVGKILKELEAIGYARIVYPRGPDGRLLGSVWDIRDHTGEPWPDRQPDELDHTAIRQWGGDVQEPPETDRRSPVERLYEETFGHAAYASLNNDARIRLCAMTNLKRARSVFALWKANGHNSRRIGSMWERYNRSTGPRTRTPASRGAKRQTDLDADMNP